jgi:hypothetical protein
MRQHNFDSPKPASAKENQFTLAQILKKTRQIYILNLALKPATSVYLSSRIRTDALDVKIEYKKHYCLNLYFRQSKFYAIGLSVQLRKSCQ